MKDLEKLGPLAEKALGRAIASRPSPVAGRRIMKLLKPLGPAVALTAEQTRDVRAVRVLERIATPEARRLLRELSTESSGLWVSQEAYQALRRLANRDPE